MTIGDPVAAVRRTGSDRTASSRARRAALAHMLRTAGAVRIADAQARFGVSTMTIRRDLLRLEREGIARRTYGGAVLRTPAGDDAGGRIAEPGTHGERVLAEAAVRQISATESVFLDASPASYRLAECLLDRDVEVTVLTNSLPIMALMARRPEAKAELIAIGGALRRRTRCYVGPQAIRSVMGHHTDHLFLSCTGVTPAGMLTDAGPLEAEVKQAMIRRAAVTTLLLDRSGLTERGPSAIGAIRDMHAVLVHGVSASELAAVGWREPHGTDQAIASPR
jgi:DeoR/GlpR family transcriptional regulator of sugar metabolism